MSQPPGQPNSASPTAGEPVPRFLIQLEPRLGSLAGNLQALVRRAPQETGMASAPFWPDVFVGSAVPWRSLAESVLTHGLLLAAIWGLSHTWLVRPRVMMHPRFERSQIVYYSVSEYLPAIKSPSPRARVPHPADPAYAPQEIISVPPEADNSEQTIITPPDVKLAARMPLPNLVAWTPVPAPVPVPGSLNSKLSLPNISTPVVPPPPEVARTAERPAPNLSQPAVVAPAPDVASAGNRAGPSLPQPRAVAPAPETTSEIAALHAANAPQPAVVGPPPPTSAMNRSAGSLNVADLQPQVAAPKLPLSAQQTAGAVAGGGGGTGGRTASDAAGTAAAAPAAAPDAHAVGFGRPAGQLIALSVAPVVPNGPINVPQGNRAGMFAAGPSGQPRAPGTPGGAGGGTAEAGNGDSGASSRKLAGITVAPGSAPPAQTGMPVVAAPKRSLMAFANAPFSFRSLPPRVHSEMPSIAPSEVDRQVFGAKKFYSITLNMPNLNSRSGSWVIRFAELNDDRTQGELTAPVIVEKVDPAYPGIIMNQHIEGIVTLYAVIGADGSVANVRVLRGVDGRLDAAARDALEHCHFRPATKNGNAVPLEAVIRIPFEVHRIPN